jgi:uncharacterized membrane protein
MSAYYYEYATKTSNRFVAAWFAFNRNVNNILVAFTARKYRMNIADVVIGDDGMEQFIPNANIFLGALLVIVVLVLVLALLFHLIKKSKTPMPFVENDE